MSSNNTVGYFGTPGSFTHAAALEYFPENSEMVNATMFDEVFSLVASGEVGSGIVPIENTLAGSLYENYDYLEQYGLSVIGETYLRIEHFLLVKKGIGATVKTLRSVYSHPKALEQCSIFFEKHPQIKACPATDTASAARFASESNDPSIAALAGKQTAELYDLDILLTNLENNNHNFTRFLIVAKNQTTILSDANKCSLVIKLPHEPGSLSKVLDFLNEQQCNLTKIESRPIHETPIQYTFYIDFLYEPKHDPKAIVAEIGTIATSVTLLGCYAASNIVK